MHFHGTKSACEVEFNTEMAEARASHCDVESVVAVPVKKGLLPGRYLSSVHTGIAANQAVKESRGGVNEEIPLSLSSSVTHRSER